MTGRRLRLDRFFLKSVVLLLMALAAVRATGLVNLAAAEDQRIAITSPTPWQVIQRVGFDPSNAAKSEPGHAAFGSAQIEVYGNLPDDVPVDSRLQYRVIAANNDQGKATDWTLAAPGSLDLKNNAFNFPLIVAAGGWYRLEITVTDEIGYRAAGSLEPFGVGEVFVIAGQSYATNTNEERLHVSDPQTRVSSLNVANSTWATAHDPQPTPDGSDGGSIWPAVGDLMVQQFHVPIGFANVAVGGTSSLEWMPSGPLHPRLKQAGAALGRFRAVLWQQGESDVIAKTSIEQYVENLQTIRRSAVRSWGFEPVWLAAKSTHHPTVYNDPEGENRIRQATEQLWSMQGFGRGPDTDTLTGENRGDQNSRRHFSAIGQRRAASMWHSVLAERISEIPTGIAAASFLLPDLHLMSPVWSADVVCRESCILRQSGVEQPIDVRLAFDCKSIHQIATADRRFQFSPAAFSFNPAHPRTIRFEHPEPVPVIDETALFPPADAANSYRHRVGHSDQNLLYQPGRWFHDRNVEITYERLQPHDEAVLEDPCLGSLPRTLARLNAGHALTIGISGDSISTGLDASVMTSAAPFQPGYPDLVTAQLRVLYDSEVTLRNRAVAGWSVANGVADLDNLLQHEPDLIIVAYGMNDVGRKDPEWYVDQTRTIIERVQTARPEAEILLVATMLGNREWIHTPRDMFSLYRDKLKELVRPGVALADVTAVWEHLCQHKHDLDLTGNGLNHPNDFGHRLYAQTILQLLVQPSE
jgi:acyl-CoA thioesterase-1